MDHFAAVVYVFSCMMISLASTTLFPPRPKMPLGYVVYIRYENPLVMGRVGSEVGNILKIKLN